MNSSLKHKEVILKHMGVIEHGNILDFGCGTGVLTNSIKEKYPTCHIVGYDTGEEMIEEAQKYAHTGIYFTTKLLGGCYRAIIMSGVLHEVYSYESEEKMRALLKDLASRITEDGKIIIREAFTPRDEYVKVYLKSQRKGKEFLEKYSEQHPWHAPSLLLLEDGYWVTGAASSVLEFLNTYTWGEKSFEREVKEKVYFYSIEEWKALASVLELKMEFELVKQVDYYQYLSRKVDISPIKHYNTHNIIVLSKFK